MFKCAFLGCGPRARRHADAYRYVKRGEIVAICDLNEERLHQFGDKYGVERRYTDADEMLERERPDLLHAVSLPSLRVPLLSIADRHGVPACITEKPIALDGADYKQLRELASTSATKYCVNTQLHFHAANLALKQDVANGRIGDVRFIDASARSTPLDQGVHVLELAHSYAGFSPLTSVFGQVAGLGDFDSAQPAPNSATFTVNFESGLRAQIVCGECAPYATPRRDVRYQHKRVGVYGSRGFVQWTMDGWERYTPEHGYEHGTHDYGEEDDLAQGRLTEAVFDWLLDGTPHPTRIERSLEEFGAVLGLYQSALRCAPVTLPFDPPDGLLADLRARMEASVVTA